jgi:AcrR family transcriptional regulator
VAESLLDAAADQVRESGYPGLTIRLVAKRAGVSAATAYTYFSSKEHLVASLFLRRLSALPNVPADPALSAPDRVSHALQAIADLIGSEPELEAAYRAALLAEDPDARRVRDAIGADLAHRVDAALGDGLDPDRREAVLLAFVGAMVLAGAGYRPFSALGDQMGAVIRLVL